MIDPVAVIPGSRHQHAPRNAMVDPDEIAHFRDRCSDLMRELLDGLAQAPDRPRPFPEIEDSIGWPRRRIASVLGGVARLRQTQFAGRRPYRFLGDSAVAIGALGTVDGCRPGAGPAGGAARRTRRTR